MAPASRCSTPVSPQPPRPRWSKPAARRLSAPTPPGPQQRWLVRRCLPVRHRYRSRHDGVPDRPQRSFRDAVRCCHRGCCRHRHGDLQQRHCVLQRGTPESSVRSRRDHLIPRSPACSSGPPGPGFLRTSFKRDSSVTNLWGTQCLKFNKPARPSVQFEYRAVEDRTASIEQGCYVSKDVAFAIITLPATRTARRRSRRNGWPTCARKSSRNACRKSGSTTTRPSTRPGKRGREAPETGVAIRNWPVASPAQVEMLLNLRIRTVEDPPTRTKKPSPYGMGGRALKQRPSTGSPALLPTGKSVEAVPVCAARRTSGSNWTSNAPPRPWLSWSVSSWQWHLPACRTKPKTTTATSSSP